MKSQNQRLGPFGARFGAPLDKNQEKWPPFSRQKANAGGCFEGMGDTGIEPVTISLQGDGQLPQMPDGN